MPTPQLMPRSCRQNTFKYREYNKVMLVLSNPRAPGSLLFNDRVSREKKFQWIAADLRAEFKGALYFLSHLCG